MEYTEIKCALAKAGAHFLFFRKKKEIFCAFLQNKNFFKNFVPKSRFCVLYIVKKHPQRQAPPPYRCSLQKTASLRGAKRRGNPPLKIHRRGSALGFPRGEAVSVRGTSR